MARGGDVVIPDGVKCIETRAFSEDELFGNDMSAECPHLTSVTIPDSVTAIEAAAFEGCSGLTCVSVPEGAEIDEDAFDKGVSITRR